MSKALQVPRGPAPAANASGVEVDTVDFGVSGLRWPGQHTETDVSPIGQQHCSRRLNQYELATSNACSAGPEPVSGRFRGDTLDTASPPVNDNAGTAESTTVTPPLSTTASRWQGWVGHRISYRNPLPELLTEPALNATLVGTPITIPGSHRAWIPVRPYRTLTATGAFALISPADIHTIHPTDGKHQPPDPPGETEDRES
jgi:hypothetical protein